MTGRFINKTKCWSEMPTTGRWLLGNVAGHANGRRNLFVSLYCPINNAIKHSEYAFTDRCTILQLNCYQDSATFQPHNHVAI
jgi:hypothetical protein